MSFFAQFSNISILRLINRKSTENAKFKSLRIENFVAHEYLIGIFAF